MKTETKIDWDKLGARERDAVVHEHVMGEIVTQELGILYKDGTKSFGNSEEYTRQKCANYQSQGLGCELITRPYIEDPYSTEIQFAWLVVERMRKLGWRLRIQDHGTEWRVTFESKGPSKVARPTYAKTAPEAICLAACRAEGVGV